MWLLKKQGFIAYLLVAFLNAFVDLGHKIIIQNTIFKLYDGQEQIILTAIVNAFILLPFILMFSPAGFLSDRFSKHLIIRLTTILAIVATLIICLAYYQGWFWTAFAMTLFIAMQSAIYSPAKYGYIRELVGSENLAAANGYVQAITIISILGGTFFFSILFENMLVDVLQQESYSAKEIIQGIAPIGWILAGLSLIEFLISLILREKHAGDSSQRFEFKHYFKGRYLKQNLDVIKERRTIVLSIIGLCLFWSISKVVLASFPAYAKEVLAETNTIVIQGILACTGIGIMFGSMFAGLMSRHHIELGFIPLGALGIVLGLLGIGFADSRISLIFIFLILGISGGLFIVPLNALIQYHARSDQLGLVLAGNNWFQNVTMLLALSLTVALAILGTNSQELFIVLAVIAFFGSLYTIKRLPHSLARIIVSVIIKRRYRIHIEGFANLPSRGGVLLLGNHVSWIDWLFLQLASPRPIRFVMLKDYYDIPLIRPILRFFGAIPIGPAQSKQALKEMAKCLDNNEVVCLFPEGQITTDGQLNRFKKGYHIALNKAEKQPAIIPFYLKGLWGSRWSKAQGKEKGQGNVFLFKRNIDIVFGEELEAMIEPEILQSKVEALRQHLKEQT